MQMNSTARKPLRARIREDIARNRDRIKKLGPGLITGGAGDDPAGIVTYTVVGASTGYSQLWLLLLSTPHDDRHPEHGGTHRHGHGEKPS